MNLHDLIFITNKLLVPVATIIGILVSGISVAITAYEVKLKNRAQTRLIKNQEIESQIQLLKLFTDLMSIAHSRKETIISDSVIEKLSFNMDELYDDERRKLVEKVINDLAVITYPVGKAEQNAAIAAIFTLAKSHEILRYPAIEGLSTLSEFIDDIPKKYLEELQACIRKTFM